jgi:hypothetical protein
VSECDKRAEADAEVGLGVVPFTYSAEVFPTVNRGMFVHGSGIDNG